MDNIYKKSIICSFILCLGSFEVVADLADISGFAYGITQDDAGYIYHATQSGAYKYDGETYIPLNDLYDVPASWAEDIRYIKGQNKLLIAYGDNGLYSVDLNSKQSKVITSEPCWKISISQAITHCQNGNSFTSYDSTNNYALVNLLPDDLIVKSLTDGYVETSNGLFQIMGKKVKLIDSQEAQYSKISSTPYGVVSWRDGSLTYYDNFGRKRSIEWPVPPTELKAIGQSVYIEKNGSVQLLSLNDFSMVNTKLNRTSSPIRRIFVDSKNNSWFISSNSIEIKPSTLNFEPLPFSSDYNLKYRFNGFEYVGTEKGLILKTLSGYQDIEPVSKLGRVITDIKGIGNKLYISSDKGVVELNTSNNNVTSIFMGYTISLSTISDKLLINSDGKGLWVYDGISTFEDISVNKTIRNKEVLQSVKIENELYILTADGFYIKESDQSIIHHGSGLGKFTDVVNFKGDIYLSSFDTGLYQLNKSGLVKLKSPLNITDLSVDSNNLYIGTINGVYKKEESEVSLISSTEKLNVTANSLYQDDSVLTFGSQYGITELDLQIKEQSLKPKLTAFSLNGHYSSEENIVFGTEDIANLHFSNFNFESKSFYQYRINNESWNDLVFPLISLQQVQPGKYQLDIRAKSVGSNYGSISSVNFEVTGNWYEGKAFNYLILTISIAAVVMIIFIATLIIRANYKVHSKLYSMLGSCSVNDALTSLMKAKSLCSSHDVNLYADGLVDLDNAIDLLVPVAHGNASLGKRTLIHGLESLKVGMQVEYVSSQIELTVSLDQRTKLEPALERDLYAVIYHAVRNSLEHGKAKKLEVFVEQVRAQLHVSIIDNGSGFSWYTKTFNFGLGLYVMKDISRKYNSKLKIKSRKSGTQIIVAFPIKNNSPVRKMKASV